MDLIINGKAMTKEAIEKAFDKIPGGLAEGKSKEDFDKKKLDAGAKIEGEHTTDYEIAEEIAADHLVEDLNYYEKLDKMEKKDMKKADLTPTKAKQILSDDSAQGHPLTDKQKRYMGWVAGGSKEAKKAEDAKEKKVEDMSPQEAAIADMRSATEMKKLKKADEEKEPDETKKSLSSDDYAVGYIEKAFPQRQGTPIGGQTPAGNYHIAEGQYSPNPPGQGQQPGQPVPPAAPAMPARPAMPAQPQPMAQPVFNQGGQQQLQQPHPTPIQPGQVPNAQPPSQAKPQTQPVNPAQFNNQQGGQARAQVENEGNGKDSGWHKQQVKTLLKDVAKLVDHPDEFNQRMELIQAHTQLAKEKAQGEGFAGQQRSFASESGKPEKGSHEKPWENQQANKSMDGIEAMEEYLRKAEGEGSRGGKIIGHTKSGKPIYGEGHAAYSTQKPWGVSLKEHPDYKHFTADEHDEAAQVHWDTYGKPKGSKFGGQLGGYTQHKYAANRIRDPENFKKSLSILSDFNKSIESTIPQTDSAGSDLLDLEKPKTELVGKTEVKGTKKDGNLDGYEEEEPEEKKLSDDEDQQDMLSSLKSVNDNDLIKAEGEGSRGGKIIGHTKSGKPIYQTSDSAVWRVKPTKKHVVMQNKRNGISQYYTHNQYDQAHEQHDEKTQHPAEYMMNAHQPVKSYKGWDKSLSSDDMVEDYLNKSDNGDLGFGITAKTLMNPHVKVSDHKVEGPVYIEKSRKGPALRPAKEQPDLLLKK